MSETFWADESVGEVDGEKHGHGTAQDIIESHRFLLSKPVTGARIGKAKPEKYDCSAE